MITWILSSIRGLWFIPLTTIVCVKVRIKGRHTIYHTVYLCRTNSEVSCRLSCL